MHGHNLCFSDTNLREIEQRIWPAHILLARLSPVDSSFLRIFPFSPICPQLLAECQELKE